MRRHRRAYAGRVRAAVFGWYGTSCACCGASADLCIDHVDGNGGQHRLELYGSRDVAGVRFWAWLIRQNFPPGYQVLCRSCGSSKGRGERCRLDHRAERIAA